ncbi:hypothetical protein [Fulvivirga sediminis]|uniref:Carboxypeptidase-like regulatory domain-containing protein n=1 Tax=Fulvivirga sediminis TaxID=2803949 RepID=A0A937F988_9BACT|nr:hypothetical protein [Fulvivirga sediminis]MBL3657556.1 hypothetical protein [Fulvivirga sediminis]
MVNKIGVKTKYISILILLLNTHCNSEISNYQGVIVGNKNVPIEGAIIVGRDHPDRKTKTDANGFFTLEARKDFMESFLYVKKDLKKIDSIQIIRTHPEYGIKYYFVNNRNDTLFLKE